jgi:hypothetical protein
MAIFRKILFVTIVLFAFTIAGKKDKDGLIFSCGNGTNCADLSPPASGCYYNDIMKFGICFHNVVGKGNIYFEGKLKEGTGSYNIPVRKNKKNKKEKKDDKKDNLRILQGVEPPCWQEGKPNPNGGNPNCNLFCIPPECFFITPQNPECSRICYQETNDPNDDEDGCCPAL